MQCLIDWYSYTSIYNHAEAYKHLLQYFTLHSHTDCVNLDNFFIITEQQQSITKKKQFSWQHERSVFIYWSTHISQACQYRNAITRMDSLLQVYATSIWNIPLRTWTDPKYIMFIALQKTLNSWLYTGSGLYVKYKYANSVVYG